MYRGWQHKKNKNNYCKNIKFKSFHNSPLIMIGLNSSQNFLPAHVNPDLMKKNRVSNIYPINNPVKRQKFDLKQ